MSPDPPAPSRELRICAIIVTFGDGARFELVEQCANSALEAGVRLVFIVLNGVTSSYAAHLRASFDVGDAVRLISLPRNLGSQGGFRAGFERARQAMGSDEKLLVLDDDDTVSREDLTAAVAVWNALNDARSILSLSKRRMGRLVPDAAPTAPRSTFLNFDLPTLVARRLRLGAARAESSSPNTAIPYAPYAGLFMPTVALDAALSLTMPDYALYEDDIAITFELAARGWALWHTTAASFVDHTETWVADGGRGANRWKALVLADSDFRVYYYVRNRTHFERSQWCVSRIRYLVNLVVMGSYIAVLGVGHGRLARLRLIAKAWTDGRRGRLGESERFPLP